MNAPMVLVQCRVCLGECEDNVMRSLFEEEDPLIEQVENCCGIKIRQSDNLPAKVCFSCCEFVRMWQNFRQMCLNSQVFWETSCPVEERPEEMQQVSDAEYMEYLYDNLKLIVAAENDFKVENLLNEGVDVILEESSPPPDEIDVNDLIVDADTNENASPAEILDAPLDAYENDAEVCEDVEFESQTADDSSLITDAYFEVDFEEEELKDDDDFLSSTPSPDPKSSSSVKRKAGRPRKPDTELKHKRKDPKSKLKASSQSQSDDQPSKFMCNLCGNIYSKKSSFTAHMTAHTNYKPHQCEICLKSFRQMGELRAHIRRHTGERPYKCMYCERYFYDRSERVRHERVHTNTRPYACQECGKSFTHTAILKNHILVHSGEKNYNCAICSKSFTLMHQLKAHLQTLTHKSKEEETLANASDVIQS
ncbi:transcription factor Ouib [Drosophila bipectinata]|uniref:transcription factor Ouib n=1 Tax=Drosophila bipectinata TaxID=42026 RepID=UPI001C89F5F2|nr:zinc finger protein 287 [Drosophila bipectinata]